MIRDQLLNVLLAARDTVCICSDFGANVSDETVPLTDCVPFDLCDVFHGTLSGDRGQDAAGSTRHL